MAKPLKVRQDIFETRLSQKCIKNKEHILQLSPYLNKRTPIKFMCLDCQTVFTVKPDNIIRTSRQKGGSRRHCRHYICPNKITRRPPNFTKLDKRIIKRDQPIFDKRLALKCKHIHEHVVRIGKYKGSSSPVKLKCLDCNKVFSVKPNRILGSHGRHYICPNKEPKRYRYDHYSINWTTKKVSSLIYSLTKGEYRLKSKYINARTSIVIEHHSKKCKYFKEHHQYYSFHMLFSSFIHSKYRCPADARNDHKSSYKYHKRITPKSFKKKLSRINKNYVLLTPYKNEDTAVLIEDHSKNCIAYKLFNKYFNWWTTPKHFFENNKCPADEAFHNGYTTYTGNRDLLGKIITYKYFHGEYRLCGHFKNNSTKALFEHHSKKCPYYKKHHRYYKFKDTLLLLRHTGCHYDDKERITRRRGIHFNKKVNKLTHGEYIPCGKYKNGRTPILMEHHSKKCKYYRDTGHYYVFYVKPKYFISGQRCPLNNSSIGERVSIIWLTKHHLIKSRSRHHLSKHSNYIYGYICKYSPYTIKSQHFDFYFPNLRYNNYFNNGVEIEINGSQHFNCTPYFNRNHNQSKWLTIINFGKRVSKDSLKTLYCYRHHIKQLNVDDPHGYHGRRWIRLINKALNKKLLPLLKQSK